ncbi:hypothetical protein C8T65DRAFT_742458 [Cerioporus squamosus]|nr:hypothetical protein C8T65DRAFT_742458 [Cerioporus squamosus]
MKVKLHLPRSSAASRPSFADPSESIPPPSTTIALMTCLKLPEFSPTTREAASTALDLTVKALENSKDVISAAPVPGLGIALDVLVKATEANRKALQSLGKTTQELAQTLVGLAQKMKGGLDEYREGSPEQSQVKEKLSGSSELTERVDKLVCELNAICEEADKLSQRRTFLFRLIYSSRDAEAVTDMTDRIAKARERFQMEGDVTTEMLVTQTLSDIKTVIAAQQKILAAQRLSEEESVLNNMPRADDANFLSAANATKARLQEGTRKKILQRLEEWEEGQFAAKGAHPVCVLVGEAGTGKSTIASEFSKRLKQRGRLGATFFFTRGLQDLNSPRKVFSTIASQLARSQPALRSHIVDAAREHLNTATVQQLEREFEDLIRRPISAISSSSHAPIFIVVDALDECTEEGPELVPNLLQLLLSAAVGPGSPLRVFLTSRPEPHYIHRVFTTPELEPRISNIHIQEFRTSVDGDIECLISAKLARHETSKRWSEEDPSRVATMVKKSEGLFIYARTAVDFLLADVDDLLSLQERYTTLLNVEGSSTGLGPVDTLYRAVLESVFPLRDRLPQTQDRLRRVLGYLVALLDPDGISPRTLEKLTNMPTTESVPILNKLRSVVLFERDNVDSRFRIIHATFREFLADRSRSGDAFYVNAEQVHGRLADECTSALRSFQDEHWPGTTGTAAVLLRLLSHPLPKGLPALADVPHVHYAYRYRNTHNRHRTSLVPVLPQDPRDCQPNCEDGALPIPPIISYVHEEDVGTMWGLIGTAVDQFRASLPTGSQLGEGLCRMVKLLQDSGVPVKGAQFAAVTMIQDIQGAGNCAISDDATNDANCSSTGTSIELFPLDALYRTLLERVFPPQERNLHTQERLKRVLGYLVTLQQHNGISLATLEKLTTMPTAESVPILKKLRSVIFFERDDVDSRFQIIHTTFREFLVDPRRAGDVFHVSAEQAHRRLADECRLTLRSFREEYWQGKSGGAVLLLALLTLDQQVLASLSHFSTRVDSATAISTSATHIRTPAENY